MNNIEVNAKYGECRCCLTMGHHRDLMKEYEWNGAREVYFKIFLECFNVFLCTKTGRSTLICTSCVLKLREASSFKKMVMEAERNLNTCEVKQEVPVTAILPSSSMAEVEIKNEEPEVQLSDADRNDWICNDDSMGEEETDNIKESIDTKLPMYCKVKRENKLEKLGYIHNTTLILENSNATPFKPKHQKGFPCFYCTTILQDQTKILEHQRRHARAQLKPVLHSQGAEAFLVYVDITDLQCTICNEQIPSLSELKLHLTKKHKKIFQDYPDRIVPFKIHTDELQCQVCKCSFETFGALDRHMNVHFRNHICKDCGTGFVTKSRLKVHIKQHDGGSYQCETCSKVYSTPLKLKSHIAVVHQMIKRFKCTECEERFTEYVKRQKHMEDVHGLAKLEYKCNVCDKVFDRKTSVSTHMKRYHLEQKDYQCELCSYSCYTNASLKLHMIKHNGERIFECSVCKKSYARKRTLSEHMRIHNNDRRFTCKVCGQAFVQNCSLKGHIKTHHPDLEV